MPEKTIDFASKNVTLDKQDELAWCYASLVSIVSKWLNNGNGWSPCQIASWAMVQNLFLGDQSDVVQERACNCCQKNKPNACKTVTAISKLRPVLNHLGMAYNQMAGPPSFTTLRKQIDLDRPVILALVRAGGPGHVSMVIGYKWPHGTPSKVIIYDPAANNLPVYKHIVDLQTMSFEIPYSDLLGKFPTARHTVGFHYINLALAGALTAAPDWAVYHA